MNFLRFSIWNNRVAFCSFNQIFVSGYQNQIINSCGYGNEFVNILFASASFGGGCSSGAYQQIEKNMQKFFFISIHKPPAWITFAPIKHTLAVTVEPFKFSSR